MKTKKWLILSAVLFLSGLVFSGIGFVGAKAKGPENQTERSITPKEYTTSIDNLEDISVTLTSENVKFEVASGDKIIVDYSDDDNNPLYSIKVSGNSLKIGNTLRNNSINNWVFDLAKLIQNGFEETFTESFTIKIPSAYTGRLNIDLTSGTLAINNLQEIADISIDKTSGTTTIKNVSIASGLLDINSTSGNITLDNCSVFKGPYGKNPAGSISVDGTSGKITLENITTDGNIDINSISGSVTLNNVDTKGSISGDFVSGSVTGNSIKSENIDINTTSGKIDLDRIELSGNYESDSISGSVNLSFTDSADSYAISTDTISGRVNLNGETGNPKADKKISVDTTSGSITIGFNAQ